MEFRTLCLVLVFVNQGCSLNGDRCLKAPAGNDLKPQEIVSMQRKRFVLIELPACLHPRVTAVQMLEQKRILTKMAPHFCDWRASVAHTEVANSTLILMDSCWRAGGDRISPLSARPQTAIGGDHGFFSTTPFFGSLPEL